MKHILVLIIALVLTGSAFGQMPDRKELPDLKFSSQAQSEIYSTVLKYYNDKESYFGFEDEDYADLWTGYETERMGAAFAHILMNFQRSSENAALNDIAAVAKAFLDNLLGTKANQTYPLNFFAYRDLVNGFLNPVKDRMIGGSQYEMNQYSRSDVEMSRFLSIVNSYLAKAGFRPSNLKVALEAEEAAWLKLRDCLGEVVYNYKVHINGGMSYSMLPLEVSGVESGADETREASSSVLYAMSQMIAGPIFLPMGDAVYDGLLEESLKEIREAAGVDISTLTQNWKNFLNCRNAVADLLPEALKTVYNKDTQRYVKFIANMTHTEE